MDPQLVALISVITSGLVAITSGVIPFINDRFRSAAQARRDQEQALTSAAHDLLQSLAYHRSGDVQAATRRSQEAVYSELLTHYYRWRLIVDCHIPEEQARMSSVGEKIESHSAVSLCELAPHIAAEIHDITRLAVGRIR